MRAGAPTLGIAGLRADQGRNARDASDACDVGNARQRQTVSMTFVARRSSMAA